MIDVTAKFAAVITVFLLAICISFLLAWPVMMLWNGCLVDAVTGVKEITWLQAWGLNILVGIMTKSGVETKAK
jgi:hypothetical protein